MIGRPAVVLPFAIAFGALFAQQPPRDAVPAGSGTASVSGAVFVDGDPGRPARRVRVTLSDLAGAWPGQTTTTDDRGTFTFRGVPAGRFELQAFKNAYLRASYGASRPERAGTPIVVSAGAVVTDLAIAIVRGGVIAGSVRDVRDRPVPGVTVRVLRLGYNAVTGERTLGTPSGGSVTLTDDRGEYRAYGLPPGSYLVLVPGPTSGRGNEPIRRLTSDDVRKALQAARSGRSAAPGAAVSPPPSSPARVSHAPVFHPGVTDIGIASIVPLGLGDERSGVDITLQLVPTATISGTVRTMSGALPPSLSVRLVPAGPETEVLAGAGLRGVTTQVQADGRYIFTGVAPGSYTVRAVVGWGRGAAPTGPTHWASADVHASGEDLFVPLTLQPGVPITGRVVFEGVQPTPTELESLSFSLVPHGSGGQAQAFGGGRVDADGRFMFANVVPDAYRFVTTWKAPGAGEKWTIRLSIANGREVLDAPLRVSANEPVEWTVTFTDRPASLTGTLVNPSGRAATEYYILVFSADRAHWTPGSRRIRMTRPATDGTFTVKGLPPGEYLLAALLDLETGEWNDPTLLEQLVASSVKVALREGETTTQNYRMGGAQPDSVRR
jgi:hypothetical protein